MRERIDRALRRQRIAVTVALAVGLLWGVATGWALRTGDTGALLTLPPLLALCWSLLRLFGRPSTAELRVAEQERAFFGPPKHGIGYRCSLLGFLAFQATYQASHPAASTPDGWRWLLGLLSGLFAVTLTVALWRRVPTVALTPDGITAGDPLRHLHVPWEALDPAVRVRSPRQSGFLRLPVRRPELIRHRGLGVRRAVAMETGELDVAPEPLVGAIRHYLAHPEHRAAIGTSEEYARLRRALGSGG
ncbi:hypothetical protein ACIBTZ_22590 [Micromonospora sp. NPDC049460]|uniref:hypothetical protein n=1 Tax=unclassified Micromonospora TaxID=2617518 RepID=UPI003722CB52